MAKARMNGFSQLPQFFLPVHSVAMSWLISRHATRGASAETRPDSVIWRLPRESFGPLADLPCLFSPCHFPLPFFSMPRPQDGAVNDIALYLWNRQCRQDTEGCSSGCRCSYPTPRSLWLSPALSISIMSIFPRFPAMPPFNCTHYQPPITINPWQHLRALGNTFNSYWLSPLLCFVAGTFARANQKRE